MAQGQEQDDSVYDFLYVDQQRVGLLLSQFGTDGVLVELVREATSGSETGGGIDIKIVKIDSKEDEGQKLSRRFDPQWLIPLLFLDQAQSKIHSDLKSAPVGGLVLVQGELWITETSAMQALYQGPALREAMTRKAELAAQEAGNPFDPTLVEVEFDIIKHSPRQVQFHLQMKDGSVWSTLRPSGLITPPEELASKHGAVIEGIWHVIGIKDAEPEPDRSIPDRRSEELAERYSSRPLLSDMLHTAEARRRMLGRPFDAYGLMPLIIFRPIG